MQAQGSHGGVDSLSIEKCSCSIPMKDTRLLCTSFGRAGLEILIQVLGAKLFDDLPVVISDLILIDLEAAGTASKAVYGLVVFGFHQSKVFPAIGDP